MADSFQFTDVTGAPLSTDVTSAPITVSGTALSSANLSYITVQDYTVNSPTSLTMSNEHNDMFITNPLVGDFNISFTDVTSFHAPEFHGNVFLYLFDSSFNNLISGAPYPWFLAARDYPEYPLELLSVGYNAYDYIDFYGSTVTWTIARTGSNISMQITDGTVTRSIAYSTAVDVRIAMAFVQSSSAYVTSHTFESWTGYSLLSGGATATIDNGTIVLNTVDTGLQSAAVFDGDSVAIKLGSSASKATTTYSRMDIDNQFDTFSVTTELETQTILDPNSVTVDPYGYTFPYNVTNNKLTLIDATTGTVDQIIPLLAPVSPLAEDATNNLFISNYWTNSLFVFNPTSKLVAKEIAVGNHPTDIAYIDEGLSVPSVYVALRGDNAIVRLDPTTHEVTNTISVAGGPYGLVADSTTSLFVTRYAADKVQHLTSTGVGTFSEVEITGFNKPLEVTAGFSSVWVTNSGSNTVSRINPASNTIITTITVGNNPWGIAANSTHIWVSNSTDGTVSKIDPSSNTVVATINVGFAPYQIKVDDNDEVWVALFGEDKVIEINPLTDSIAKTITVNPTSYDMELLNGKIWVMDSWQDTPDRLQATDQTPESLYFVPQLAADLNTLITSNTVTVSGLNVTTPASIETNMHSAQLYKNGISVGTSTTVYNGDELYITLQSSVDYSVTTESVLTVGGVQSPFTVRTADPIEDPNPFSFTAVNNATTGIVYTSNTITISGLTAGVSTPVTVSNGSIVKNTVDIGAGPTTAINGDTFAIKLTSSVMFCETVTATLTVGNISSTYVVTTTSGASEYVLDANRYYDPYWDGSEPFTPNLATTKSVALIDITSGAKTSLAIPDNTDLVAAAAIKDFVYVANYYHDSISQIDPDTLTTVRYITLANGDRPHGLTYAPRVSGSTVQTKLWASLAGANQVVSFDLTTMAVDDVINVGVRPLGIGSTEDGSVFVANRGSNTVTKISPTLTTSNVGVGSLPFELVVDNSDRVWVTNSGANTVSVINGSTNSIITTITVGANPWGIAYGAGYIWVSNIYDNSVTVIDPSLFSVVTTISVGVMPYNIVIDSNDKVWVSHFGEDKLYRIDPTTFLIDFQVSSVGYCNYSAAFVPNDNRVWVTQYYSNTPSRTAPINLSPTGLTFDTLEVGLNETVISNEVEITGLDREVTVSVPNLYNAVIYKNSVASGQSVTVTNGDFIKLQMDAANDFNVTRTLSVSFCGSLVEWTITTIPDVVPDLFSFGSGNDAIIRELTWSNDSPITGMDTGFFALGLLVQPTGVSGAAYANVQDSGSIRVNGIESVEDFPTTLTELDTYYAIKVSPLNFKLAATNQDALDGISIGTGGSGAAGIQQNGGLDDPIPFVAIDGTTWRTSIEHGLQTGDPIVVEAATIAKIFNNDVVAIAVYPAGPYGSTHTYHLNISGVVGDFSVRTINLVGAIEYPQLNNPRFASQPTAIEYSPNPVGFKSSYTALQTASTVSTSSQGGFIKSQIVPQTIARTGTIHKKLGVTATTGRTATKAQASGYLVDANLFVENTSNGAYENENLTTYDYPNKSSERTITPTFEISDRRKEFIFLELGPPEPIKAAVGAQITINQLYAARSTHTVHTDDMVYEKKIDGTIEAINHQHIKGSYPAEHTHDYTQLKNPGPTVKTIDHQHTKSDRSWIAMSGYGSIKTVSAVYETTGKSALKVTNNSANGSAKIATRFQYSGQLVNGLAPVRSQQKVANVTGPTVAQSDNTYVHAQNTLTPMVNVTVVDEYTGPTTCPDLDMFATSTDALNACVAAGNAVGTCSTGQWANGCWYWTYDIVDDTVCDVINVTPIDELEIVAGYIQGG